MSKYDSHYYNSEQYYDPTAGSALSNLIREEKKSFRSMPMRFEAINNKKIEYRNQALDFSKIFAKFYQTAFGLRANGKMRRLAYYENVYKLLRTYEYCIAHVDDEDFTIQSAVEYLDLGTDRTVKQVFTGQGNMGKVVKCYKSWLSTGEFTWGKDPEKLISQ